MMNVSLQDQRMLVRRRLRLGGLRALLVLVAACTDPALKGQRGVDGAPAPAKPVWLTAEELERAVKPFEKDTTKTDAFVNDLDVFVLMSATTKKQNRDEAVAGTVLLVKHLLHRLYYSVSLETTVHPSEDPAFYNALCTFERRAGLKVDGRFSLSEFNRLQFLASLEGEQEVRTTLKLVHGTSAFASAEGTWTAEGDPLSYPVNRIHIDCWRDRRDCTMFSANLSLPSGKETDLSGMLLTTDVVHYDVVQWKNDEVIAQNPTQCRQNTLTINWTTQQVYLISHDTTKSGCPFLGPLPKPRLTTLAGPESITQLFKSRQEMLKDISDSPLTRARTLLSGAAVGQSEPGPQRQDR